MNANEFNHVIIKKISFKSFGGLIRLFVDHIAFLTADLRNLSEMIPTFCRKEAMESFPAEGTMEQYVEITEGAPSLLHPISIQTLAQGVAWLCRSGLPFLIELSEGEVIAEHKTCDAFELGLPRNSQSPSSQIPDFAAQIFTNLRIQVNAADELSLKAGNNLIQLPLL